jgi:hypothetical protein
MLLTKKKSFAIVATSVAAVALLAGCSTDAQTVSHNISNEAGQFGVQRQVVVKDDITNTYIEQITGDCDVEPSGATLDIICQIKPGKSTDDYVKDIVRVGQNDSWVVHQLVGTHVSKYHYEILFKPTAIPNIDTETGGGK